MMVGAGRAAGALLVVACLVTMPEGTRADTVANTTQFEWDATGLLLRETLEPDSPQECVTRVHTYDARGNRIATTAAPCIGATGHAVASAAPRTQRLAYGGDGRFAERATNSLGQMEARSFDAVSGAPVRVVDANGLATTWELDALGRPSRQVHPDGTFTRWQRLRCGSPDIDCSFAQAAGQPPVAWVLREQAYAASGAPMAAARTQYHDPLGRVLRVQSAGFDGLPVVQDTEYDRHGRVQRRSSPYAPDDRRVPPSWTTLRYDVLGRLLAQQEPDASAPAGVASVGYEYDGLVTTVTDTLGRRTRTDRNARGQAVRVMDALGGVLSHQWDAAGRLVRTESSGAGPGAATTLSWDRRGRKVAMSDPSLGTWRYGWNAFGERVWQQDSLGQASTMAYDALGRLVQRTEPDLVSSWRYDRGADGAPCGVASVGRLCEARSDNGYLRTHRFDAAGRLVTSSTVLDNATQPAVMTQVWDPDTGRVAEQGWPTGLRARWQYTPGGWLRQVVAEGAGLPQPAQLQLIAMDPRGQLTSWRQGMAIEGRRRFDGDTGRLLDQQVSGVGGMLLLSQAWSWDSQGNLRTRQERVPGAAWQEAYAHDALDRLNLYTTLGAPQLPAQSVQLQYDARGNIAYKSDVGRYAYDIQRPDRLLRIVPESAPGAAVPVTGTRTMTWAYDGAAAPPLVPPLPPLPPPPAGAPFPPPQVTPPPPPPAPPSPAPDPSGPPRGNGNLVSSLGVETSGTRVLRTHGYTSFDMPRQSTWTVLSASDNPAAPATPPQRTLRYVHGPEHQRMRLQTEVPGDASRSNSTWYLHAEGGQQLLYEKVVDGAGRTEHRHYLSAAGMTWAVVVTRGTAPSAATPAVLTPPTPLQASAPEAAVRYLQQDHLGSLVVISDEAGNLLERLAYDPWGKRRHPDGRADPQDQLTGWQSDRGYTLHEHLDELGLVHMNGRVYDPLAARFLTADPFVQSPDNLQSHNRYAYVGNNPLAHTDPSGYFSLGRIFRAAVAITAAVFAPEVFATWGANYAGMTAATSTAFGNVSAGALAGAVSTGNLRGTIHGAVGASLFSAAGAVGSPTSLERYIAHAAAGCIGAAVGGGRCGDGAAGAVAGKFTTNALDGMAQGDFGKGVAAAIGGGVGAVAAGGRFEQAAISAGLGFAFNYCQSAGTCWAQAQEHVGKFASAIGNAFTRTAWELTPGTGAIDCLTSGCSSVAAIAAAADFIPGGNVVRLGERGLAHILARHVAGGAELDATKSIFFSATDLSSLASRAELVQPVFSRGRYVRVVDAGRPIGMDRLTGQATSTYTVVTGRGGDVVTMHPGAPRVP